MVLNMGHAVPSTTARWVHRLLLPTISPSSWKAVSTLTLPTKKKKRIEFGKPWPPGSRFVRAGWWRAQRLRTRRTMKMSWASNLDICQWVPSFVVAPGINVTKKKKKILAPQIYQRCQGRNRWDHNCSTRNNSSSSVYKQISDPQMNRTNLSTKSRMYRVMRLLGRNNAVTFKFKIPIVIFRWQILSCSV